MEDSRYRTVNFEEAALTALRGCEALPTEVADQIELADRLAPFASLEGSGYSVVMFGFPSAEVAAEGGEAILSRIGSAPEPDDMKVSELPGDTYSVSFRFF